MAGTLAWEFDEQADHFFIHFDVAEHHLNLDTFIQTADSARKIVEALNSTFFKSELGFEIIVLPPSEGTFLTRLAIGTGTLLGGAGAFLMGIAELSDKAISFVESDVGAAYVESLTGKAPEVWARDLGKAHRATLEQPMTQTGEPSPTDEIVEPIEPKADRESRFDLGSAGCRPVLQLVTSMTRGILELDTDALAKIGMEIGNLPDALDARAEFYEACYHDPDVKRVGFTPEDDFPIPRNSFPERAQKPARKKKEDEEPEWVVAIEGIYVTSPNWDQEDQKTRQWKGKDAVRRDCYFVIEDQEFWFRVRRKRLHVEVLDSLKVQWAYQVVGNKPQKRRVLRVLEFNGDKLAEPLPADAINSILGSYSNVDASRGSPTLFD